MRRISFINGICVQHDAISASVREALLALSATGRYDLRLFAYSCQYPELPFQSVRGLGDVLLSRHYQTSDLIVFDFGVYYPLFDLLMAVPQQATSLVSFHNITPKKWVDQSAHDLVDRSFAQIANIRFADHVICVSETNREVLIEHNIQVPTSVLPLAVRAGPPPKEKPSVAEGVLRIAFVGRFVKSKGTLDLLNVLLSAQELPVSSPIEVDLVGNTLFSDPVYVDQIRQMAASLEDRTRVRIHTSASDEHKWEILSRADLFVLPTYHEGFCVPIIEALAAGCRVIAYDNSNVPEISGGFARLVPTGDLEALSKTLAEEMLVVRSAAWRSPEAGGYREYAAHTARYTAKFAPEIRAHKFVYLVDSLID